MTTKATTYRVAIMDGNGTVIDSALVTTDPTSDCEDMEYADRNARTGIEGFIVGAIRRDEMARGLVPAD